MPYYFFTWTPENIDHLAENDVTPEEFVEVVSAPKWILNSRSSGRPIAFGYTSSGRFLACVYRQLDADTILAVTAYEPTED